MRFRIPYLIVVLLLSTPFGIAQTSSLTGDWTGESICFGNNSSCHDEKVVYHISIDPSDSTKVKIAADKIVDGKPDPMGVIDLKYDAGKQTLTGELQNARYRGVWEFTVKGNIIEGGLYILPDRVTGRKIRVQKNESIKKENGKHSYEFDYSLGYHLRISEPQCLLVADHSAAPADFFLSETRAGRADCATKAGYGALCQGTARISSAGNEPAIPGDRGRGANQS